LILENDKDAADTYKEWLLALRKRTDVVHFFEKTRAYEYAIQNKVDLFIIDTGPEGSDPEGYEFAERLRKSNTYEMSFIILTSPDTDKKQVAYEGLKCHHYFVKPVEKEEFDRVMSKVLRYRITEEENRRLLFDAKDGAATRLYREQIFWVEINKKVVTVNGRKKELVKLQAHQYPLERLEKKLGDRFMRIRQNLIVNKDYVQSVDYTRRIVKISTGDMPACVNMVFRMGNTYVEKVRLEWE